MGVSFIRQESIADQVFTNIKRMILAGEFMGGEKIPEEAIAKKFGVSRTPVREALKKLEQYGLIQIKPRSYAEVIKMNKKDTENIAEVRASIEGLAVKLLTKQIKENQLQSLYMLAKECDNAFNSGDIARTFESDSKFHLSMATYSGNDQIVEILERLDARIQLYRLSKCVTTGKIEGNLKQHHEILDNIKKGNHCEAARIMKMHAFASRKQEG